MTLKRQQSIKNPLQYSFSKASNYSEDPISVQSPNDQKYSKENIQEGDTNTSANLCDLYLNNNIFDVNIQTHFKKPRESGGSGSSKNENFSFNYNTFGANDRTEPQSPPKKFTENILGDLSYDNIHNNLPTTGNNSSNKNESYLS